MSKQRPYCPAVQQPNLRAAFIVGILAALLRVAWVLIASRQPVGLSDPLLYLNSGAAIAAGDGYISLLGNPTAYYPPGYPYFLGGIQWALKMLGLVDHRVLVVGLLQALLGGIAAGALVVTGDQLFANGRRSQEAQEPSHRWSIGVIAGMLYACWPNLILHAPIIMSESLFLAVFSVLLAVLVTWTSRSAACANPDKKRSQPAWRLSALIVIATMLCTWIRPQSIFLLLPAIVVAWRLGRSGWRRTLQGAALVLLGMVFAVVPWTIRNAIVMGHFIPMSTNTGDNLCIGFHTGATGAFTLGPAACATEGRYIDGPDIEVARDGELRDRAIRWIVEHPAQLPALSLKKLVATFRFDDDALFGWEGFGADLHLEPSERRYLRAIGNGYYWIIGLLATVGLGLVVRDYWRVYQEPKVIAAIQNSVLIVAVAASGALVPVLFFGDSRFKVPIVPCLALLAALAIHSLLLAHQDRET
jgi:hypothetical protein